MHLFVPLVSADYLHLAHFCVSRRAGASRGLSEGVKPAMIRPMAGLVIALQLARVGSQASGTRSVFGRMSSCLMVLALCSGFDCTLELSA